MAKDLEPDRFVRCLQALGAQRLEDVWLERLRVAYAEAHRAYHNAPHIADCLDRLDEARHLAQRPAEIEAALWYHDVVYDPRAKDNEEQSARWAQRDLIAAGVPAETIERITALILPTQHQSEPPTPDAALLVDIDLSILGRDETEFAAYDQAIRVEYGWVPEDQYKQGRAAVLQTFLERPVIFRTEFFRDRYEAAARRNLTTAIARLRE